MSMHFEIDPQNDKKATKQDDGKPRFDLIPPECLLELAKLYEVALHKYPADNWKGLDDDRIFAAMSRHLNAWHRGEIVDSDDGQFHMTAVAWGAFGILWKYLQRQTDENH